MAVIPVNKYKQVTNPSNGINDQFLNSVTIDKIMQLNQKMIDEILNVTVAVSPFKLNNPLK